MVNKGVKVASIMEKVNIYVDQGVLSCLLGTRLSLQQTRDIKTMLGRCLPDVVDGGPTSNQHWFNVSYSLGCTTKGISVRVHHTHILHDIHNGGTRPFCSAKPKGSNCLLTCIKVSNNLLPFGFARQHCYLGSCLLEFISDDRNSEYVAFYRSWVYFTNARDMII